MGLSEAVTELSELLTIARDAAALASGALKAHREAWAVVTGGEGREVKIDADVRAEALVLDALAKRAPFPIISEERGKVAGAAGDYVWAVDPLDGSVNYLRGYPHCAVSIGLLKHGAPVLGVVDCFVMAETFSGVVGQGAWLNGASIKVSNVADPKAGILQTGVPARARTDAAAMAAMGELINRWQKVRMIGSAATALAYVAAGRAEAYRESGSMIWDVAGGCALVAAAGGEVRIEGGLDSPLEVAAGNKCVALPD
ncbi:MAG: inositol monophosphatase [Hyphomonadaceae bacterium]|nr:inositol monophosphatase [Hyphomonadaceae bacterium]